MLNAMLLQFQPVLSKSQQQGDGSMRKDSRKKGADNDANPIGAAQAAS